METPQRRGWGSSRFELVSQIRGHRRDHCRGLGFPIPFSQRVSCYFPRPSHDELERLGTLAVFLGYYFPWDVRTSYDMARKNGFKANPQGSNTGTLEFADIDDDFISIHHYLKWHKFDSQELSTTFFEIRHGRITRDQAISTAMKLRMPFPCQISKSFVIFRAFQPERYFSK